MGVFRSPKGKLFVMSGITLALLASLTYKFWRYNYGPKFRADEYRILDQPVPRDFWFAPDGRLVTVAIAGSDISVYKWHLDKGTYSRYGFDVRKLSARGPSASYILDKCGDGSLESALPDSVLFSFSQNGDLVAWADRGFLSFAEVTRKGLRYKSLPFKLGGGSYVEHLSFTDSGMVTIIYDNGMLESIDLSRRRVGEAGTTLPGGWSLWSHGPVMAFSHFDTGDAAVVQINGPDKIDHFAHSDITGGVSLAAWGADRLVIGRSDGSVAMLRRNTAPGPFSSIPLVSGRPVWAVAFYDSKRMFAGGDFPGVYNIEYQGNSFVPRLLLEEAAGVRRIAVAKDHIAVLTSSALAVASIGSHPALSDDGTFIFNLISFVLSLVGFVPTVVAFMKTKKVNASPTP